MGENEQNIMYFEEEIEIADGVMLRVALNEERARMVQEYQDVLRTMRGIKNVGLINVNDEDVQRIAKNRGVVFQKKRGARDRAMIRMAINAVKRYHAEQDQAVVMSSIVLAIVDDLFVRQKRMGKIEINLRADVLKLLDKEEVKETLTRWFEEPDDWEPDNAPSPVYRDATIPAERAAALFQAVSEQLPAFNQRLGDVLSRIEMLDEGGVESVDEQGFHSEPVDDSLGETVQRSVSVKSGRANGSGTTDKKISGHDEVPEQG